MSRGFSSTNIDRTDLIQGFSVIDGRVLEHEQRLNDLGEEVNSTQTLSFSEKYSSKTEEAIGLLDATQSINKDSHFHPAGLILAALIDTKIQSLKVAWYGLKEDGDEPNNELMDEVRQELFQETMSSLQLSWHLSARREALRYYWGSDTDARFKWILDHYSASNRQVDNETLKGNVSEFIKILNKKLDRKTTEDKEEYRLIWSVFGLINIGIDPSFPLVTSSHDRNDSEAYKGICRAISSYIFWSLVEKKRRDTEWDGEEPGPVYSSESEDHKYERDYSQLEMMARDGSAEPWLNMCFSNFTFEEKGEDKQILYRKATDAREAINSIKKAVSLGNWILSLYNKGVNLHTFRLKRIGHPTNGLSIINLIKYYGGHHITSYKKVDFEGKDFPCKRFSDQLILSYQYGQLMKLFWATYRNQQSEGIIKDTSQLYLPV